MGSSLTVEGQYSQRHFTFEHDGSLYTDLVKGTVLIDESTGGYYNSPSFCGVCTNEKRDNQDFFVKGRWFLSTSGLGSHNIVFGYDNFAGKELLNNYQSGSNYVVGSTAAIPKSGDLFPVFDSSRYIVYFPITQQSSGSDVRTHSVFLNDSWRLDDCLSFSLGMRWDKNAAKDGGGVTRANDSAWSPRLGAIWDTLGDGKLRVAASYAKYVGAIQETQVSSATQAGTPLILYWYYDGPGATPINADPNGTLLTRAQALTQLFDWFQNQGCPNLSTCKVPLGGAQVSGVNQQIQGSLDSPNATEYTIGIQGALGARASYRIDAVRRAFHDFYSLRLDQGTGQVTDQFGNVYDLQLTQNTNDLERNYTALQTQFKYQPFRRLTLGGSWTWSHTLGNFNGETAGSGAIRGLPDFYPEYSQASWGIPCGDLDLLLHVARRLPHGQRLAPGPFREILVSHRRRRRDVRASASLQRLQQLGGHRCRYDGALGRQCGWLPAFQPVHDAACPGRELGLRFRFRQAAERRGLSDPTDFPALRGGAFLACSPLPVASR